MTGLLLVVSPQSSKVRMIGSICIGVLCLFFVMSFRPFLNDSHNTVLASGQSVVAITIIGGFIVEVADLADPWKMGVFLLVLNISIVLATFALRLTERLHALLDAIIAREPIDAAVVAAQFEGNGRAAICDALLKSTFACLKNVEIGSKGGDEEADRSFEYFTKVLLPLTNKFRQLLFTLPVPSGVKLATFIKGSADDGGSGLLFTDLPAFEKLARGLYGSLVSIADIRAIFELLSEGRDPEARSTDFSFDEISIDGGVKGASSGRSFSGANPIMMGDVEMVAPSKHAGSTMNPVHFTRDLEDGLNETIANAEHELRRAEAGITHLAHQVQDGVNDRLSRIAGTEEPQHHADNPRGYGAPPGGDGIADSPSGDEEEEEEEEEVEEEEDYEEGSITAIEMPDHGQEDETEAAPAPRRSSIWYQDERSTLYSSTHADDGHEDDNDDGGDERGGGRGSDDVIAVDASDVEMAETGSSPLHRRSSAAQKGLSPEQVKRGLRLLEQKVAEANPAPTLFDVVQTMGMRCHKSIIAEQEAAAARMLSDPEWGAKIKAIKHDEVPAGTRQQLALTMANLAKSVCTRDGFDTWVDENTIPSLLCGVAHQVRETFEEALLGVAASAKEATPGRSKVDGAAVVAIELKVGPVKKADRISVKVQGYAGEKGIDEFPHSQFVTDVLRASFIVDTAEDMVRVWESLQVSSDFQVVRLKNKIGKCEAPFNLHANITYRPAGCADPITCELQFYPRAVYDLQHRQHLAYEIRRAPGVEQLL